ncbi:tRNA (adenosine(37)-N6)-threonylcarbamoyltransferase complex dimerization subunit type 1 TsaB [Sphingorhabdus wooponensis]|uniref:tRNA (Adenosine(37)-N6)-threonylcarbamoyltransferase complex dimerization subunit type 1 TsaB n=1 Tax=Sphingorhabdus wooponensis TaxID=940136 RepID=A0A3R8Q3F5_9SPHN|nr:tRNA (adenosine(37)-N6)-threonylcarbamoyltransferase complex dimerization subunit type 1 TsaB [Sphingorhabdus wooponensis]RRQ52394.1 tRNA (adenosine(37)-N6)-threonylcarbamoyltransferase complex dimerization subunit type 1 TsaB [Sphingorhabdus wooponensis]
MRTLVIDTATRACSVALFDDDHVVAAAHEVIGRGHAERLLPLIATLPSNGKADQVMVNVGPGSFTGIRVGVAAAKALGLAWHVEVHGYGCLALVAAMGRSQLTEPAPIDVVMTGGHGEYFFEAFDAQGHSCAPARSVLPSDLLNLSTATVVAGDIDPQSTDRHWLDLLPDARHWVHLRANLPLAATPIYGRAPDAKPAPLSK